MSTLASTTVTVTRIGKHCGAEISGVDLSQPLDDETFAEIRDAFFENEVVFFRNQRLTPQQQVDFTRRFGDLEHHVRKESLLAGFPEILVISNILDEKGNAIGSQDAGRFWHSDVSYKAQPSMLSALYALEVPITKDGTVLGHTKFASSTAAYDALPDTMKQYLAGKKNVHSYRDYRRKNLEAQKEELARGGRVIQEHAVTEEQLKRVPDIDVPVVRTHPITGRKGLFVNEGHTSGMADMPKEEGDALLAELYRHITQPQFVYRHEWQAGDLLMWDNCAVQHKATFDYDLPLRRLMHRTTVRGTAPF
jgi:taurine dioxygenase